MVEYLKNWRSEILENQIGLEEIESLAEKVLRDIPTGTELIRLGPRPLFIEFCGTPKAGKTTCVDRLTLFLKRNGFNVLKIVERAGLCPLRNKHHMMFNVWTMCTSLVQMIEAREKDYDVVILDRGIFDSLCWMNFMEMTGRLTDSEKRIIDSFLLLDRWKSLVDIVFVMTTTPQEAINREFQEQLTQKRGSIMNEDIIALFNKAIEKTYEDTAETFKAVLKINTTNSLPIDSAKTVANKSLQILNDLLDEEVMVIKRELIKPFDFKDGFIGDTKELFEIINNKHYFVSRRKAEDSIDLIQIIPCAIVEYDNKVMLLRRKERDSQDRLHNKYAIWAGGHARKQDKTDNGSNTILNALNREIDEELFIKISQKKTLIAFVYDQTNPRSKLHMGVIYRLEVNSPEVYLAMNQQEFKEKRGLSVSGRFFSPDDIMNKYYPELETWSRNLLIHFYKASPPEKKENDNQLSLGLPGLPK